MANRTSPTEQRPFTAVVVRHEDLTSLDDLSRLIGRGEPRPVSEFSAGHWKVWRWEYLHTRNLYPASNLFGDERSREGGWAHDIYVGQRMIAGASFMVLASPYVRLLRQLNEELKGALSKGPALRYLNVDMSRVFASFQSGSSQLTATKVTLEILDELEVLELVSLTGSNPLNSKLHAKIQSVAAPYAIRVEIESGMQRARLSIDRVGNLWWYQSDERKTELIFLALDDLINLGAAKVGRRLPLDLKFKRDVNSSQDDSTPEEDD